MRALYPIVREKKRTLIADAEIARRELDGREDAKGMVLD